MGGERVEVCGVWGRKAGGRSVERSEWRVVDALGGRSEKQQALDALGSGAWTRWAVGVAGLGCVGRSVWRVVDALGGRNGGWWTRWTYGVAGGGRVGRVVWKSWVCLIFKVSGGLWVGRSLD